MFYNSKEHFTKMTESHTRRVVVLIFADQLMMKHSCVSVVNLGQ